MDTITHFSHEHPLHLFKQKPTDAKKRYCYACEVPLIEEREHLVEVYGCELCHQFFLHKYCAQLPMEIEHKVHKNHSLFLVLKSPGTYKYSKCQCQNQSCSPYTFFRHFFYYCYVCDFLLEPDCAFREKDSIVWSKKELIFHHPSHKQHPLMVLARPASVPCDACGVEAKDLFYLCPPCQYGIHKRCAMLPSTTTHDIHSHPLTLSLIGLPSQYRINKYHAYYCDICGDKLSWMNNEFWLYYCELCRYFVHIRCMAKKKPQIEVDLTGLNIDELPHLPTSDNSVELIQRCLLENNSLPSSEQVISMFSHEHPLIYSNGQFMEDENEDGQEIVCDACIYPILTPPYYRCAKCRYFLHPTCANLPRQLQHRTHPHQLILTSKPRFDELFLCDGCRKESNGFFFHCTTDGCEFNLDLKCAALPKVIVHAYHNHPLFQIPEVSKICRGCNSDLDKNCYGCIACKFYLHPQCVLLPKTSKHRHDTKHPLILRFPPHSYHPKPFDCYQCESEINPNYWLYHCEECDLSFHVDCFYPARRYYNVKFGQEAQIGSHPHPLKFVLQASVSSSRCHNCPSDYSNFSFECEICNFRLCKLCVEQITL